MSNVVEQAAATLKSVPYATLATVTPEGQPWNTPVAHNLDESLNISWGSDQANQHSVNIRRNGRVFVVVFDSMAPAGEGFGVYLQCQARQIETIEEVREIQALHSTQSQNPDDFFGDSLRRLFVAEPKRVWVNDAEIVDGEFIRDFRIELDISELQTAYSA